MSLQFISNSVLRGDASFSTGSAALFQSSGNNTTSDTWIYNSGSLADGYQLDFGHGIVRTSTNIIMTLKDENVGIGTTSPIANLQITTPNASTPTSNIFLDIDGSTQVGMGGQIIFGTSTSSNLTSYTARIQGVRSALDNGSSDLYFQTTHVATSTSPSTKMIIKSDGKVGIGTTSPNRSLHVIGQIAIDNSTSPSGGLLVSPDGTSNKVYSRTGNAISTAHPLDFISGSSTSMRIAANGDVGIGTTGPTTKLNVSGNIAVSSGSYLSFIDSNLSYNKIGRNTSVGGIQITTGAIATMNLLDNGSVGIGNTAPTFYSGYSTIALGGTSSTSKGLIKFGSETDNDGPEIFTNTDKDLFFNKAGSGTNMILYGTGTVRFNGYNSANQTGTPTYMLGTDASGNVVKVLGGDIPGGGGTVTGSGTAEYIPKWNSTSALVNSKAFQSTASSITTFNIGTPTLTCDFLNYQDTTGAIAGKVPIIEAKAAVIGIGARDKTYTTIYEGIKIIPATSHYLTRITPRLEVYPYEDPSTTTDNTYDTSFVGSCFSMGSQNTIGNSASSNLGVFGFNNTIAGDKFVIIGQGNVLGKANVSSLAVGTTNTNSGNGKLVNSLLVGQNMTLTQPATRSIVAGINHSFQGAMNNTVIVGSGNQGFGSNNFIWGSSNQGSGVNNMMLGGFSGQITSSSGNLYGSALMGWNNTLQTSPRATFVTGRDNVVIDTDYSIIGGFNNDTSAYHSSLLVGTKNYGRGVGNIIGGESNTVENNSSSYNLIGGFKNTVSSTSNLVVGTNNTVKSTTKGNIVGGNNNNIDVAANENNIISGIGNDIFVGSDNIVAGNGNNVGILSNTSSKIARSIIVGQNNSVGTYSASGVAAKSNMAIFGSSNSARGNNTFVAGANNSGFADNAIVLGNGNSSGGVASGENKVIQIGFSIQPNSQSDYLAIGYGMSALPTTAVDNNNIANKYTAIGRNPDNNVDYDLSSLDPVSFIVGAGTQQNYRRTAIAVTCKNSSSEESNVILPGVGKYRNYTNDTTAAAGGVPLYGLYHTSGTIKIRIA